MTEVFRIRGDVTEMTAKTQFGTKSTDVVGVKFSVRSRDGDGELWSALMDVPLGFIPDELKIGSEVVVHLSMDPDNDDEPEPVGWEGTD